jgi:hypothetical protein
MQALPLFPARRKVAFFHVHGERGDEPHSVRRAALPVLHGAQGHPRPHFLARPGAMDGAVAKRWDLLGALVPVAATDIMFKSRGA